MTNYFNITPSSVQNRQQAIEAILKSVAGTSAPLAMTNPTTSSAKRLLAEFRATKRVNFEETNALALEYIHEILESILPDGELRGQRYVALNPTRNDVNPGSFGIDIEKGIWADFATDDKGGDVVSFVKYVNNLDSQPEAAVKILEFIAGIEPLAKISPIETSFKPNQKKKVNFEYTHIFPIPEDAKERIKFFGKDLGFPSHIWEYKNAEGKTLFYVNRFETVSGKEFRPLSYCMDSTGHKSWQLLAPPSPRPAYGLEKLAANPDSPVIFTEGEKAADAAQRLFPGFVAVTTMNGAKSPEKTDFSPFAGRNVYIAPDNDQPGFDYALKLRALLSNVKANVIGILKSEVLAKDSNLVKGYDLADAEADGWTAEKIVHLGEGLWDLPVPSIVEPSFALASPISLQRSDVRRSTTKKKDVELADEYMALHHDNKIVCFNNQLRAYQNGYWPALNPEVHVKKQLAAAMGELATAGKVNSVFELIKIKSAATPESFERKSPLICLNNGTLNPMTGELQGHSPDHLLTNKLDIDFDAQAQCPLWLQTLNEIFAPDADKAEKIQLLQEFIGYCQIPDTRFPQFLWLVGAGGNGKSLILSVLTSLIGKVNISYAQLENLSEKFVRAELQGKLVNISSEMSSQATVADGYLKQITAGDIIQAERKNERPFSFKPYARLIGATNALPRLLDHTGGFFRRAMIIRLNRQFAESEQDRQREAHLLAELPAILNWAVAGLQTLLRRGNYLIPASCKAEVAQYRLNSDPVRLFAEEYLTQTDDKKSWTLSSEIFSTFKNWCNDNGYGRMGHNKFAERLTETGFTKEKRRMGRFWNAILYPAGGAPQVLNLQTPSTSSSGQLFLV